MALDELGASGTELYKRYKWNLEVAPEWLAASGNVYKTDGWETIYIPSMLGADCDEAQTCGQFVFVSEGDRLGGSAGAAEGEGDKL